MPRIFQSVSRIAGVIPVAWLCISFIVNDVCAQDADQTVDIVDPSRIPPAPVLSPAQAIADFVVEDGFMIELVAAEPDVIDPVAITFDEYGAIWVVEMRGYMPDPEGTGEERPIGRIVVLKDLDLNGDYEDSQVFLDGLVLPRAVSIYRGGVLVAVPPNLLFVENNSYEAGNIAVLDSTYAIGGNPEHQPNGLLLAEDNWIYSAKSDQRYQFKDGTWHKEKTEFRGQWGITQDDWGRLFYNTNSQTLLGDEYRPNVFPLNPHHDLPGNYAYGANRASNRVYPRRVTPGVNRGYQPDVLDEDGRLINVTSAAGPAIYRGDLFPRSHRGNAFVPEPAANLVKRIVLHEDDGTIMGTFPYENREFITSTDERFRPVNAYTAPDGSLYIVDMYRGIIQHSTYLTPYLKRQIQMRGLSLPLGLGRIYRIRPVNLNLDISPMPGSASNESLVQMLTHDNGWYRDTAQRLLIERDARDVVKALVDVAKNTDRPVSQVHALWTLDGLGQIDVGVLGAASNSDDDHVIETVIQLCRNVPQDERDSAISLLMQIANRGDDSVNATVAAVLHSFRERHEDMVFDAQISIAATHGANQRVVDAILGGLEDREDQFLDQMNAGDYLRGPSGNGLREALGSAAGRAKTRDVSAARYLSEEHLPIFEAGRAVFAQNCATCHGLDGIGLSGLAPPLQQSSWVLQDEERLARLVLDGLVGPISVDGTLYEDSQVAGLMPGSRFTRLSDEDLSAVLTYIRNEWQNRAPTISTGTIQKVRTNTERHTQPYTPEELVLSEGGWTSLFDGVSLSGWNQVNGSARYEVEQGEIVGYTVLGSRNSFLATERSYDDFILDLEFLVDSTINSGVQIRSHSDPQYLNGAVHGYQIEIDPSPRAWTGGLYDESRRGWIYDLAGKTAAQKAFRQGAWNHFRIEVRGDHIRTWLNDVLATDVLDSMTSEGFIALQVHGISSPEQEGRQVRWRNIRIKEYKP